MFLCQFNVVAQVELHINKTTEIIKVDGVLDEQVWIDAEKAEEFEVHYPENKGKAKSKTEVQMTYDNKNLYIAAKCFDDFPDKKYTAQSLKRDFSFPVNDAFVIFIDNYGDMNNGLSFGVTPYGVQRDGSLPQGGRSGVYTAWNGLWEAEVQRKDGFWTVEMSIPFRTLQYKPDAGEWKINFARNDLKRNERSTWVKVPRGTNVAMLGHTGTLIWDNPPEQPKRKITLIPYAAFNMLRDVENNESIEYRPNAGLDAKISLTSSLTLDATINPDFSQIEVDRQVVNVDRFELSFPERRLFFLENNDMFSLLGNSRVRPLFSRRIGGVGSNPVSILGGLKLSGEIGKNWKIGVLSVQTKKEENVDDSQNYTIASITRKFTRDDIVNSLTGHIANRKAFQKDSFNLTGGLEYNYRKNSVVTGHAYAYFSRTEEKLNRFMAYGAKIRYQTRKINIFAGMDAAGDNYITDMGYVPRLVHTGVNGARARIGYHQFRTNGSYWFYFPKVEKENGKLRQLDFMGPYFGLNVFTNSNLSYQEHEAKLGWRTTMHNTSSFEAEYIQSNTKLFLPFSIVGLDSLFHIDNYVEHNFRAACNSPKKNIFNAKVEFTYGDRFTGKQMSVAGEVNYRFKKWGAFGVNFSQTELFGFPPGYGTSSISLVGAKTEFSFSRNVFWTTFLQYNTQQSNFNVNSRFQWRYKPASDIYLVFTNNHDINPIEEKNWQIALKINYWFNL